MIEFESNLTTGPQEFEVDVEGEDGFVVITVRDTSSVSDGIQLMTEDPSVIDQLITELKQALEDAF